MTFEKEFPSLKGKAPEYEFYKHGNYVNEQAVLIKDIQKYCLDKQKVREAFKNCATVWDYEKAKKELR